MAGHQNRLDLADAGMITGARFQCGIWCVGHLQEPLASTKYFRTDVACDSSITIPKCLLFHGVPAPLVPPTITFLISILCIREAIGTNFEV